jgi:hypothetical protein
MKHQAGGVARRVEHKIDLGVDHFVRKLLLALGIDLDLWLPCNLRVEAIPLTGDGENKVWRQLMKKTPGEVRCPLQELSPRFRSFAARFDHPGRCPISG